jgi:hypothetical protein
MKSQAEIVWKQIESFVGKQVTEDLVFKLVSILYLNGHEISIPSKIIGIGLYPSGAIFNHSCKPNATFFHDNKVNIFFRRF